MGRLLGATVLLVACLAAQAVALDECLYAVKSGDTFYEIAVRLGVPVADVLELNPGVKPEELRIGQIINIPCVACGYTVQPKDTMPKVAKLYGTTIKQLKKLNDGLTPANFTAYVDEDIVVPCPCEHTIKAGQTWNKIAKLYKSTPNRLKKLNPDQKAPIGSSVGKAIAVPCPPTCDYKVLPRQTFKKLAKKFKVSLNTLLTLNPGVTREELKAGLIIRVPCAKA